MSTSQHRETALKYSRSSERGHYAPFHALDKEAYEASFQSVRDDIRKQRLREARAEEKILKDEPGFFNRVLSFLFGARHA